MEKIIIVFDGSAIQNRIGAGWVVYQGGQITDVDSQLTEKHGVPYQHTTEAAEAIGAILALSTTGLPKNQPIEIYGDNIQVMDFMKNREGTFDKSLNKIFQILLSIMDKFDDLTAIHRDDRGGSTICPGHLFAIANNAATSATGAKKKTPTGTYTGKHSFQASPSGAMDIIDSSTPEDYPSFDPRAPDFKL